MPKFTVIITTIIKKSEAKKFTKQISGLLKKLVENFSIKFEPVKEDKKAATENKKN